MRRIAGIILAAGYSSRMSALKALYPVDKITVLEKAVRTLNSAGLSPIHIVTGYKNHLIEKLITGLGTECPNVHTVYNPGYDDGMYSSVLTGIGSLSQDTDGFVMLPVDYPFVQSSTILKLCEEFESSDADIISPLYEGRAGHPPLIRQTVFECISEGCGEGGLRAVLADSEFSRLELETGDPGILDDIDDDVAYLELMRKYYGGGAAYPVSGEITKIRKELGVPAGLASHMDKVNELAVDFCEQLNAAGLLLNPGLLSAACRLHDICKGEPEHAAAAAEKLTGMGFPAVAEIVSQHMEIDYTAGAPLTEAALLYLADKLTEGEQRLDLSTRMNAKLEYFAGNPEAEANIRARFTKASLIKKKFEIITGSNL